MSFFKKTDPSAISQGKLLDFNNFLSFTVIGILFSDLYFLLKHYFFYDPVLNVIVVFGLGGICIGNLMGRLFYSKFRNARLISILSEAVFSIVFVLYTLRNIIIPGPGEFLIQSFFSFKYGIPALLLLASFSFGVKINHSLRISCGDYIDKKMGTERFARALLAGTLLGMVLAGVFFSFDIPLFYLAPLAIALVTSIVLINLPYHPAPLRVDAAADDEQEKETLSRPERRADAVLFTYLNFVSIVFYAYLGITAISKYYGDLAYVGTIFMTVLLAAMLSGYAAGGFIRVPYLHVYGASSFPLAFLAFLAILISSNRALYVVSAILLFVPLGFLLGAVLRLSIGALCRRWDSKKKSTVMEFSFFILPVPIVISLGLIDFTNLIYYAIACVVMLMNVVIPSISMINHDMKLYRKGLYYFFSLLFLPFVIFMVLFFKIPLDTAIYAARVENFDELKNINYNADYIRSNAVITMSGEPVFVVSDSVVRNLKRALVPIVLHHPEKKKMLVIDGYQRFFRNPVIGYYKNSTCLDVLTDRDVDYNRLPYSGTQKYVPDNHSILLYLERNRNAYFTIVDVPNLLDQTMGRFRFSEEYYRILKGRLERSGLLVQVFSVPGCRPELFADALHGLKNLFKKQIVYYFSNVMVVLASDDDGAFTVGQDSYERLIGLFKSHDETGKMFLNEPHVLSHLLFTRLDDLLAVAPVGSFFPAMMLTGTGRIRFPAQLEENFTLKNTKMFELVGADADQRAFVQTIAGFFQADDAILTLLKKTELAEAREKYREETGLLFELKKQAEYRIPLQEYVRSMLAYKEKYYYAAALRLEKNKKWEEARELYRAVLKINPDNFDANYRMGLLCITLQDIEGSFNYFQEAMRINKDHPKVLFQMGILYYSSGKTGEAVEYFNKALQQNEKMPQLFRYLGLCYEKLENLPEAERYYARALLADPDDTDTKARLEDVRMKIQKESKKWETPEMKNEMDVEQDSDMPLPVSKGAYDIRLKDNDSTLPVIDPVTGDEIKTEDADGSATVAPQPEKK